MGEVTLAVDHGGDLWISYGSQGPSDIYFAVGPDMPPPVGTVLGDDTITVVQHYFIVNGACAGQPPSTTPPPVGSYSDSTTTATTRTSTTSTTPTPTPLPAGSNYICESNSQTNPSVEKKSFAKKLWDKGNWIPYATSRSLGSTRIGGGYSLICNPLRSHLKFTVGKWVDGSGRQVGFLDQDHYSRVVSGV